MSSIVKGKSVGERIGSGEANVIKNVHDIEKFGKGEVLVTEMTDPDWEPIMKIAAAIVTNRGGRTCFAGDTKILTNKGFMEIKEDLAEIPTVIGTVISGAGPSIIVIYENNNFDEINQKIKFIRDHEGSARALLQEATQKIMRKDDSLRCFKKAFFEIIKELS